LDRSGNLYIADRGNHRIRRVRARNRVITTVAGNGQRGFSGDGGPAGKASLADPFDLTLDRRGNLYIADTGNKRVRRVDGRTKRIETVPVKPPSKEKEPSSEEKKEDQSS
jgi:internalin A